MMITDQISAAVAGILAAASLPHDPTVQPMVADLENSEEVCRVIVNATTSELRKPSLPGIYDVSGEVVIQHSMDADGVDSPAENFQEVCDAVRGVIGAKYGMPTSIQAEDEDLHIFSWNLTGQENVNVARCFLARFAWTACARQDPHNSTA